MDAVELLQHDHRVVEQLFRDYRAAASDAQQRGVVDVLIRELSKHAALEEVIFYPFAAKVLDDGQVDGHLAQHAPIKELLLQLDRCGCSDPAQDQLMERLRPPSPATCMTTRTSSCRCCAGRRTNRRYASWDRRSTRASGALPRVRTRTHRTSLRHWPSRHRWQPSTTGFATACKGGHAHDAGYARHRRGDPAGKRVRRGHHSLDLRGHEL
ncbi:hemerythrin domain-containing protein [Micromonospora sp. ATA32]|nr:hemerythrin domain-containing protein [Micromonospora sp. ATA32]